MTNFVYTEALFNYTDINYHISSLLVKEANTFYEVGEPLMYIHVCMYMYVYEAISLHLVMLFSMIVHVHVLHVRVCGCCQLRVKLLVLS